MNQVLPIEQLWTTLRGKETEFKTRLTTVKPEFGTRLEALKTRMQNEANVFIMPRNTYDTDNKEE